MWSSCLRLSALEACAWASKMLCCDACVWQKHSSSSMPANLLVQHSEALHRHTDACILSESYLSAAPRSWTQRRYLAHRRPIDWSRYFVGGDLLFDIIVSGLVCSTSSCHLSLLWWFWAHGLQIWKIKRLDRTFASVADWSSSACARTRLGPSVARSFAVAQAIV